MKTFTALAVAVIASVTPAGTRIARAQPAPAPVITIEEQISGLQEMITEVESGRTMILAPHGAGAFGFSSSMLAVPRDRVGAIGGWLVATGQIDPDSIPKWTEMQIGLSRGALLTMKRELAALEARRDGRPPPPDPDAPPPAQPGTPAVNSVGVQPVYWPTPMDWREVGGAVRGTYTVLCFSDDDRLPLLRGTFHLELRGKGVVLGSFTDTEDGVTEAVEGTISQSGFAEGGTANTLSSTRWSTQLVRQRDAIVLMNPTLIMNPGGDWRCDPGAVDQTS